jgi:hypothetical protein
MPLSAVTRQSQALTASAQEVDCSMFKGLIGACDVPGQPPGSFGGVGGANLVPGQGGPSAIVKDVVEGALGGWQKALIRLGVGLAGVALIAVGANMLVKQSGFADSAKQIAMLAATKGAA